MTALRAWLRDKRGFAAAVILAALFLRVVTPLGFMPTFEHGHIAVLVCHGTAVTVQVDTPAKTPLQGAAERCAFADLAVPLLGSIDPIQLGLALAFILLLWLAAPAIIHLRAPPHLRPPLRAPPAAA